MKNLNFHNKNIYSAPGKNCPLCKSTDIKPLYTIDRYEPAFKVDRCGKCRFIFMNPKFKKQVIKKLYKKDYYSGNADYSYQDEREMAVHAGYVQDKRVRFIHKFIHKGNFLDIGAAFGGLLESAKDYFTPYGIDLSEYAGKYIKKLHGNRIHIGTLEDHPFKHNFFSAITMIELIEHLHNPLFAIRECYKLLKKDSLLVIQTANMDGMQAKIFKDQCTYFLPGHLSYFTKKNLTELLLETGFKKIKIFYPVEFGLIPKLRKSSYNYTSILDYRHWIRIAFYHLISKIHAGNFASTSSMVVYAFK